MNMIDDCCAHMVFSSHISANISCKMYFPVEYCKVMKIQKSKVCSIQHVSHRIMATARGKIFSRGQTLRQKNQSSDLIKQSSSSCLFHPAPNFRNMFRLLAVYYIQKDARLTF